MNTDCWLCRSSISWRQLFLFVAAFALQSSLLQGQTPEYALRVEILIEPSPSHRLQTQIWGRVFQELERRAVFRSGRNGERTRVEDSEFRGSKSVTAVGILNRNGSITFGHQTFVATRPEPLKMWLDRIERFGADGPPNENPTWGLSTEQFEQVLKLLSKPVEDTVRLKTPMDAVDSLSLPATFRIAFTDGGKKRAFPKVIYTEATTDEFQGLSKGSALAAALAQFGLGYRPKPGPNGKYILEIDAGTEVDNMYPIGWKNTAPIMSIVPGLGKTLPVDLEDANLDALIALIANKLSVRRSTSSFALATEGKHLPSMKYSRKPDKLSLGRLMNIVGTKNDISLSLRTDEAGTVFLWATTRDDEKAFKKRFAHIRPVP